MLSLSASISEVEQAVESMREALDHTVDVMERLARWREHEGSLLEFVDKLMADEQDEPRLRANGAMARLEHSMMIFRAKLVQGLVEEEGMSLTTVGEHLGISRQMTSRLYRAAAAI